MPSGIWHGTIAFGLVNVPVRMYTATTDHDIRFHQVHAADGGRVRYERVCSECGARPVDILDIDRLYESPVGDKVIVSDADLARLPAAEKSEIEVLQFVPFTDRSSPYTGLELRLYVAYMRAACMLRLPWKFIAAPPRRS